MAILHKAGPTFTNAYNFNITDLDFNGIWTPQFFIGDGGGSNLFKGSQSISSGKFTPVALTVDRDKEIRIFVDGVLNASFPVATSGFSLTNSDPLQIGKIADQTVNLFNGGIDDVRIFGGVLTAEEIKELTVIETPPPTEEPPTEEPKPTPDPLGPIALWSLDEKIGLTVKDSTGNGHDGIINRLNPVPGIFDGALAFSSTFNDQINFGVKPVFALPEQATLALWVNPSSTGGNVTVMRVDNHLGEGPREAYTFQTSILHLQY